MGNSGFQVWISWDSKIKTTTKNLENQCQVLNFLFFRPESIHSAITSFQYERTFNTTPFLKLQTM